jgi:hypothetical protein
VRGRPWPPRTPCPGLPLSEWRRGGLSPRAGHFAIGAFPGITRAMGGGPLRRGRRHGGAPRIVLWLRVGRAPQGPRPLGRPALRPSGSLAWILVFHYKLPYNHSTFGPLR